MIFSIIEYNFKGLIEIPINNVVKLDGDLPGTFGFNKTQEKFNRMLSLKLLL